MPMGWFWRSYQCASSRKALSLVIETSMAVFRLSWAKIGMVHPVTNSMSFMIGAALVPVSFILGLVYSSIRRAVRVGVEQGSAPASDS